MSGAWKYSGPCRETGYDPENDREAFEALRLEPVTESEAIATLEEFRARTFALPGEPPW